MHIQDIIFTERHKKKHLFCTNVLSLDLLLFTDGGRIAKSKNYQVWPLIATIAQLPPNLRNSLRNTVWMGIW